MSLKPYPEYSEVIQGWVPRLPSGWRITQLRHIARIYAGGTPDRTNMEFWSNGTIPWLNSGSVNDWIITSPSEWISEAAASGGGTRWVPPKSVLVALAGQGKTKGLAARLEIRSTCNQSMAAIVPTKELEYRFLQFWIAANYQNVRNLAGGDLRDGLNLQHIGGIYTPVPTFKEQVAIADHLDRETGEIDAFIADQEELIVLLRERRTATITQAVTKGLDPDVPMKDSGVEWLGDVPEGWSVQRLSHVTNAVIDCLHSTPEKSDDGTFISIRTGCIRNGELFPEKGLTIDEVTFLERTAKGTPEVGDVLFTREAPAGEAAVVDNLYQYALGQRMVLLKPSPELLDSRFLVWNIYMPHVRRYIDVEANGSTVKNLPIPDIKSIPIVVPRQDQQQRIIEYLHRENTEIDAAIKDAREAIKLSKERRAAVISAAVTGKNDVRGALASATTKVEAESVGVA